MKKTSVFRTIIALLAVALMLSACVGEQGATTTSGPAGTTEPTTNGSTGTTQPTTRPTIEPTAPTGPDIPVVQEGFAVTMADNAAVTLQGNLELGKRVEAGTVVSFTLKISDLYEGTPVVKAGEQVLEADAQGMYAFEVTADTVITVEGLTLKTSNMSGTGDSTSDPFLITSAVDLLYIAEQVNAGNETYTNGFYRLENDVDCQGMLLSVIGDGNSDPAVFAGYFDGNGCTVSNYRMQSTGQYVGLFGVLQADLTGNGGGTVYNLKLKDFVIDATAVNSGAFIGSVVGYGMGGNLMLCSAENGRINIYADQNSFSYAGGLIGIQQALDYDSYAYYSSISYCNADVDVSCNSGLVYAAGGIAGYITASNGGVVASINNSYATGDVYGAMRCGGLIGYMGSGSSVVTSYATGVVSAQSSSVDKVNSADFCYAYAGGLVGYAETDSVIADCFSVSKLQAVASLGADYQVTDGTLAYAAEPDEFDYGAEKATVYNCLYVRGGKDETTDLTKGEDIRRQLKWTELDWVFTDGEYPVVNTDVNEIEFDVTISLDGQPTTFEDVNVYMPLHFWYSDNTLPSRLLAADGGTRISYGYYFDEECTMPVPDSYIPTRTITLYAAVADVADVAGEYVFVLSGTDRLAYLTLNTDGTFTYSDAGKLAMSGYFYDGEKIVFEDARFARFISNAGLEHYQSSTYCASVDADGNLRIIGGAHDDGTGYNTVAYFTETAPLIARSLRNALSGSYADDRGVYTFYADGTGTYESADGMERVTYIRNGRSLSLTVGGQNITGSVDGGVITLNAAALKQLDMYSGSWSIDSKANKVLSFDGNGNWSYLYFGYKANGNKTVYDRASGTYTIDENLLLHLDGDLTGKVWLENGALLAKIDDRVTSYHRDGSYFGTWVYPDYGMTLYLDGVGQDGQGTARVEYLYANGTVEAYDLVCAIDEQYGDRLCLYYENDIFGYVTYIPGDDLLNATIYVGSLGTFMANVNMGSVDAYAGEWVGQLEGLNSLQFNGYGSYTIGSLIIGEEEVSYLLDDATLTGSFVYNGDTYFIAYDEATRTVRVTCGDESAVYCRKDSFGDLTLTDGNGSFYTFSGRNSLAEQGVMYVNGTAAYTYEIRNGELEIFLDGEQIGSMNVADDVYVLHLPNMPLTTLRIHTWFTDTWAMSGSPEANMVIGTMDLNDRLEGVVNGQNVVFTLNERGYLEFTFPGNSTPFYVIRVGEDIVIDSTLEWYLYGTQIEGARIDDMYGTWKNSLGAAYQFDGMSGSSLTAGLAQSGSLNGGVFSGSTAYGYSFNDAGRCILWTTSSTTGETLVYRLNFCDPGTRRAFVNADGTRAFTVETGNQLYLLEALDEQSDTVYTFDGFSEVTTSDGASYTYQFVSIDYDNSIVIARITIDGEIWVATIDFSDVQATITLEKA